MKNRELNELKKKLTRNEMKSIVGGDDCGFCAVCKDNTGSPVSYHESYGDCNEQVLTFFCGSNEAYSECERTYSWCGF